VVGWEEGPTLYRKCVCVRERERASVCEKERERERVYGVVGKEETLILYRTFVCV